MKTIIVLMLLAILGALASAGFFMLKKGGADGQRKGRMAQALALRVGLSVAVFLFVLLSWAMGWIRAGGLPVAP